MTNFGGQTQCINLPCNITNCAYCFQSSTCLVCKVGYNLVNGTCNQYSLPSTCTVPNCVLCNSNNQCTQCLNGYLLYNGSCVCNFQNCLSCVGSAFCTQCAFPTIATLASQAGCIPEVVPSTICNVANCLNCQNSNICAQCDNGFTLQSDGSCLQNICNRANNCSLCSVNQLICYTCNPGYIQSTLFGPSCTQISSSYSCQVAGCAVCTSANVCKTCSPFYNITSQGTCTPFTCVANCLFCLASNTCLICEAGFIYTTGNTCISNTTTAVSCFNTISNCFACVNQTSGPVICKTCNFGLQPSSNGQSCVPQTCNAPNCAICLQNTGNYNTYNNQAQLCFVCKQGYFINSYFQCVSYNPAISTVNCSNIYNCLYCANSNYCDYCAPNWNATSGVCLTSTFCNVANCLTCTSPNFCVSCAANYQASPNNSTCIPQCTIANCTLCASLTTCQICASTYILNTNSSQCICPNNLVTLMNGYCGCTTGYTNYNTYCYACNI